MKKSMRQSKMKFGNEPAQNAVSPMILITLNVLTVNLITVNRHRRD